MDLLQKYWEGPVYILVTNTLPRVRNAENSITLHNQTPRLGHKLWKCEGGIGLSIWIFKKKIQFPHKPGFAPSPSWFVSLAMQMGEH